MQNFLNKPTIREILDYFPDEIPEIVPREISRLEEELKPLKKLITSYHNENYEPWILKFYTTTAVMFSGCEHKLNYIKKLKLLLSMHKHRSNPPSPNRITDEKIQLAKQQLIKDMYSFDRLKPIGGKFKASCPFHADKTPSFLIYESNTFHCFSCGTGGSAIDFYMKINNIDFKSAVNALTQ